MKAGSSRLGASPWHPPHHLLPPQNHPHRRCCRVSPWSCRTVPPRFCPPAAVVIAAAAWAAGWTGACCPPPAGPARGRR
eukprot:268242-Chlamydomonas_euryale.AAC.1